MAQDTSRLIFEFNGREAAESALRRLEADGFDMGRVRMHGRDRVNLRDWNSHSLVTRSVLTGAAISGPVAGTFGLILGLASLGNPAIHESYLVQVLAYVILTATVGLTASTFVGSVYGLIEEGKETPDWFFRKYGRAPRAGQFMVMVQGDATTLARAEQNLTPLHPRSQSRVAWDQLFPLASAS